MKKNRNIFITLIIILSLSFTTYSNNFYSGDTLTYSGMDRYNMSEYSDSEVNLSTKNSLFKRGQVHTLYKQATEGNLDIFNHIKEVNLLKNIGIKNLMSINDNERKFRSLSSQIEDMDEYINAVVDLMIDSRNNYNNLEAFANVIISKDLEPDTLEAYLFFPVIDSFTEAFKSNPDIAPADTYNYFSDLGYKIRKNINNGKFQEKIKNLEIADEELISVSEVGVKSVRVVYFNRETNTFVSRYAFPGTMIGNVKVRAVYDDGLALYNTETDSSIVKQYVPASGTTGTAPVPFDDLPEEYKIVPWFGEDYAFSVRDGGTLNIYLKVIDKQGMKVEPVTLNIDGQEYKSDEKGMITISLEADRFNTDEEFFTVSLNDNVTADFNVEIKPRDMILSYSASVGLNVGVGLEPVVAGATIGVKPDIDGGIMFFADDIKDRMKDRLVYQTFPSLSGSFSATLGPKVKPLDVSFLSHNFGAGAGATVGASASVKAGFSTKHLFANPYSKEGLRAQTVYLLDRLLYFQGPFQPIATRAVQKMSGVDIKEHQMYAGLSISGKIGVNGDIGGQLGLINNDNKVNFGGQAKVVSGSGNLSVGVDAGTIGGFDIFGPTDDKYNVALKSSLAGNFSALEFQSKIFGKNIIPAWWLTNVDGSVNANLIFRFDENFNLNRSLVIFSMGYKFQPNVYNRAIDFLKEQLKDDGARANDYAEIYDAQGLTKMYIFIIDKEKTEKYFAEWAAFSRTLLTEKNEQDQQTVVAKVKGLFGDISKSFKKLASTPIFMVERTELVLSHMKPEVGINVSAGIKVNLGIQTQFQKTKAFTDRVGYFSGFKLYPIEEYGYTADIARADREITMLLNEIRGHVAQELSDGASYVFEKAADGTVYIAQKAADGAVYVISVAADGTADIAKKVGAAAKDAWNNVLGSVGKAAHYVGKKTQQAASAVSGALSSAWSWATGR
ncbi:MAG: hypothetical protein ACQESP_03260 [Candidatus Muiribacteriota bacterium]